MDLFNTLQVAAAGLRAQAGRMRVISENLANANSTAQVKGQEPYRRKIATFVQEFDREIGATLVKNGRIAKDQTDFGKKYAPGHPAADNKGYILTPNVNTLIETVDMREAQRTYEANLNVISSTRRILSTTLDILRT